MLRDAGESWFINAVQYKIVWDGGGRVWYPSTFAHTPDTSHRPNKIEWWYSNKNYFRFEVRDTSNDAWIHKMIPSVQSGSDCRRSLSWGMCLARFWSRFFHDYSASSIQCLLTYSDGGRTHPFIVVSKFVFSSRLCTSGWTKRTVYLI